MRRMTSEAIPIPLNVSAAPANRKQGGVNNQGQASTSHALLYGCSVQPLRSYQNSWQRLLPPWLRNRGPDPGEDPAGYPVPTSWAPAGLLRSDRRYRQPKRMHVSHLGDTERWGWRNVAPSQRHNREFKTWCYIIYPPGGGVNSAWCRIHTIIFFSFLRSFTSNHMSCWCSLTHYSGKQNDFFLKGFSWSQSHHVFFWGFRGLLYLTSIIIRDSLKTRFFPEKHIFQLVPGWFYT